MKIEEVVFSSIMERRSICMSFLFSLLLLCQYVPLTQMPDKENLYKNTIRSSSPENQWEFALSIEGDLSEFNNESVNSIVTDSLGNVFVTGTFQSENLGLGGFNLVNSNAGTTDIFLGKWNKSTSWVWAISFGGKGNDLITDLEISEQSKLVISGAYFTDPNHIDDSFHSVSFGAIQKSGKGGLDIFVAEISVDGAWDWVLNAGGDGNDIPSDLEISDSGLISISGDYSGSYCLFESINLSKSQLENKGFIARITNSGFWVWANQINGNGFSKVNRISDDASDNLYVTGDYKHNFSTPNGNLYQEYSNTQSSFIAQISNNGEWNWVVFMNSERSFSSSIDVLGSSLIVGGSFEGYLNLGAYNLSASANMDGYIAKLSTSAITEWAIKLGDNGSNLNGDSNERVKNIKFFQSNSIFVSGEFEHSIYAGGNELATSGSSDIFYGELSGAGSWMKIDHIFGVLDEKVTDMHISNQGDVYHSGSYNASSQPVLFGTHEIGNLGGREEGFVAKLSGDFDQDGVINHNDLCPTGLNNWFSDNNTDTDADGCKNDVEDFDNDNDGILNLDEVNQNLDQCPQGRTNWLSNTTNDKDQDGCHDESEDNDDDGDGVDDSTDECQVLLNWVSDENTDNDGDGCHDEFEDNDDDNDGLIDITDSCPLQFGTSHESELIGCEDIDGDGWADSIDSFPENPTQWNDTDSDGFGDNWANESWNDTRDDDGTWLENASDIDWCPNASGNSTEDRSGCLDTDGDGYSDPDDEWALENGADAFPRDKNYSGDADLDAVPDRIDNCPNTSGTSSENSVIGCNDADDDGWADTIDQFPNNASEWSDSDMDGLGDNADMFPDNASAKFDTDLDGIDDTIDAFPLDSTEWKDSDMDGFGDNIDKFPLDDTEWSDLDLDGFGDNIDQFPYDPKKALENLKNESLESENQTNDYAESITDNLETDQNAGDFAKIGGGLFGLITIIIIFSLINSSSRFYRNSVFFIELADTKAELRQAKGMLKKGLRLNKIKNEKFQELVHEIHVKMSSISGGGARSSGAAELINTIRRGEGSFHPVNEEQHSDWESQYAKAVRDDSYSIDEHGATWWKDGRNQWWVRPPHRSDWVRAPNNVISSKELLFKKQRRR